MALAAVDVASGKELWRLETKGIDPAKTAVAADRVFFYADRSYASCVNLKTGKTIWKAASPIVKNPRGDGWSITFMVTARVGALASPDVYVINSYKDGHYQAFSAKDGSILWGKGRGRDKVLPPYGPLSEAGQLGKLDYPILTDGKLMDKNGTFYDPLTGKPTGEKVFTSAFQTCGSFCISTHGVHGGGGTCYDRDARARIEANGYMKAACLSGTVVAGGLLLSGHGTCGGCYEWLGHLAFRSAGDLALRDAVSATTDRLLGGKPVDQPGIESTPKDWTTYRADNSRSGSSAAMVCGAGKVLWTWAPNPPFDYKAELGCGLETQSTQPVCVAESVVFGTAAGIVRCLDRRTGVELWNYPTAGRIISAPTFWEGKLYVGSGDGRVYCLSARDGSLVWRYRVAPVERRIMVFSHLMSAWPVNANVLVVPSAEPGRGGAVAYASAGLVGIAGGTFLCAMDARTGKPLWETSLNEACAAAPNAHTPPVKPSATGQMAWYNGQLWLHAGDSGVFIVDPITGKASQAIDFDKLAKFPGALSMDFHRWATYSVNRGQDIGILPGGWVVLGGRQFYLGSDILAQPRNMSTFLRAKPDWPR